MQVYTVCKKYSKLTWKNFSSHGTTKSPWKKFKWSGKWQPYFYHHAQHFIDNCRGFQISTCI